MPNPKRFTRLIVAIACCCQLSAALAFDIERPEIQAFIDRMVAAHKMDRETVTGYLEQAESRQDILDAISRPAERVRPWHEYRAIFLTEKRIEAGAEFWKEHEAAITEISRETGVPGEIIVGIIGVETFYGRITGRYKVLDALSTLGFDYPPRSKFFSRELEEFLLLANEQQLDINETLGSYAGAMGAPQFIPSSYRAYARDGDGDNRVDLFSSWPDVMASVANYFVAHRWRAGQPVVSRSYLNEGFSVTLPERNRLKINSTAGELRDTGVRINAAVGADEGSTFIILEGEKRNEYWTGFHNFYVITRYNRSVMYALAVWQLGEAIAERRESQ